MRAEKRCPDCGESLRMNAMQCGCGWRGSHATGRIQTMCMVSECGKEADVVLNGVGRCCFHHMQELDKTRKSALMKRPAHSQEMGQRLNALREQMLNPGWFRDQPADIQRETREECLRLLRSALR